jgi:hypothetical protein
MSRAAPSGPGRRRRATPARVAALRVMSAVGVVLALGAAALFVPGSPFARSLSGRTAAQGADPTGSTSPGVATGSEPAPTPTPKPTPSPTLAPLRFRNATVVTPADLQFFSWSLMDRRTGQIWGSANQNAPTWPASMIKVWIAADFLRRQSEDNETVGQDRLDEITALIRDSDNDAAEDLFYNNGGNAVITRLVGLCKLTDSSLDSRGWGFVNISARDTVRMADCIADGTAAGPQWTDYVLNLMRNVREGNWGIRDALQPADAAKVAIKNGWLDYDDDGYWHVNCMAVGDTWAMSVMQRYPIDGPHNTESFGAQNCENVAAQLLNPAYIAA